MVRQTIFLGKNLYHLVLEPEVALKSLIIKKDKSEIFLLTLVLSLPSWGYMASRIVWDKWQYGLMMPRTGVVFQICATLQALVVIFVGWGLWRGRK